MHGAVPIQIMVAGADAPRPDPVFRRNPGPLQERIQLSQRLLASRDHATEEMFVLQFMRIDSGVVG